MSEILIFGGTTEGRILAETICENGGTCTISVATEYGEEVLKDTDGEVTGLKIRKGRLDTAAMERLLKQGNYSIVIDATHIFAVEVSQNIKEASTLANVPYYRLLRNKEQMEKEQNIVWFENQFACIKYLEKTSGKILLTSGSKELPLYAADEELRRRLVVRVLPGADSIKICQENKIAGKQIIAMQGPFSQAMNEVIMEEYGIKIMVTKESGHVGGQLEKVMAAKKCGVHICMIGRPKEQGYSFDEICNILQKNMGGEITLSEKSGQQNIYLVGTGMGAVGTWTGEVISIVKSADVVFGAERILASVKQEIVKVPFYLAKDIIPYLKEHSNYQNAVVLFSGDTGFYSGMEKLNEAIEKEVRANHWKVKVLILPGISSISYLAAKLHINWQDAKIISMHGKNANVIGAIKKNRKTFLLVSGIVDIQSICEKLIQKDMEQVQIFLGFSLSYRDEKIYTFYPANIPETLSQGLYTCYFYNPMATEVLTYGLADYLFIRDRVPLTKSEIRAVAISKLQLTKNAVVYDIGSGTGSVTIECAELSDKIHVYAIEKKPEAMELTKKNCDKFDLNNVTYVEGDAPNVLLNLPSPTHVFIGGSSGKLKEIVEILKEKTHSTRVVINTVTVETLCEISNLISSMEVQDLSITQMQVSHGKAIGAYHMMQAENPVTIFSFTMIGAMETDEQ
ncbi:MAG: precorrin-6A reductase [Velocimicrobium sp.]